MRDAYTVLGIAPGADEESIKKAYRQKCKQYHPDLHPNDPAAEERFKEVQAAYSEIMRQKNGGGPTGSGYSAPYGGYTGRAQSQTSQQADDPFGFGGFGFGPFGFGFYQSGQSGDTGFGSYGQSRTGEDTSPELKAAGNYIRNGYYQEALTVLDAMPQSERTACWHYYAALANSGLGNNVRAQSEARMAVNMEPGNYKYQNLLDRLQNPGSAYTEQQSRYAQPRGGYNNICQCCVTAWIMQMICSVLSFCCCGGRGGFYC